MIKNFLGGIAVGVANIIPGVSGGTIIVILGLFDKIMQAISDTFKFKIDFKTRLKSMIFLGQFILGAIIGLVVFAKILELLFVKFEIPTIYWFIGLIIFSLPVIKKHELGNEKISWLLVFLGVLLIGLLAYFSPGSKESIVPLSELLNRDLTLIYAMTLVFIGILSGATTIFPGISGSMVLLVVGYYHLFKGYVANVTAFDLRILIPVGLIGIGVAIGVIFGAKIVTILLDKSKSKTISFILGLILMSAIVIIPLEGYNTINIISSIITFIFGATIVTLLGNKKKS